MTAAVEDKAQQEYIAAATEGMNRDDNSAFSAQIDALGPTLLAEFDRATRDRRETEERWLQDLRQYRGIYDPDVLAKIGPSRSKAFVRATRVKVKTVDARVADLLFPTTSDRNWTAEPTAVPSIDRDSKTALVQELAAKLERKPERREIEDAIAKLVKQAADKMTKVMDDQLSEVRYTEIARDILHSGHLYGTGVLKAPLVERKTRTKFVKENGKWVMKTETYVVPFLAYVPLWRFYPDMSATRLEDCAYVYELHEMPRHALAQLAQRKKFDGRKIREYIRANPKGARRRMTTHDTEIRQIGQRTAANHTGEDGKYEVLERWGWLDGDMLAQTNLVTVPEDRMHETFFANVWLLPNGEIIKISLQPINGVTYPYHLYYCDKDETSIFGDGFPAIMRDDQTMINAGTRMVLDNGALTAGPQLEVNMKLLSPSEKADDMYPFKIWARNGDAADANAPAVRVINIPNGLEYLMPIVDMFQRNADDVTAIPRYMQGQNATQGAAGTASGMSMLMANASIVMKDLLTNYDVVTRSFIDALYKWNMQFNPDDSIKGDYDIKARGTASLMAKEIRAQQLDQFAATISPEDAPYIKREELLRQRAQAHDLSSIIKTEDEVEAERNNDAAKQAAAMQQQISDLQLREAQLRVARLEGEVEKVAAERDRLLAQATETNVKAAYAGMQAGGVATSRPDIAPAGDAILRSAGFVDKTPQEPTPAAAQAAPGAEIAPAPAAPVPAGAEVGANAGMQAGIETPQIEG